MKTKRNEAETLIASLHTLPLNSSVTFTKERYISVNSSPNMLNDIHRFCVLGNSILRIDTTFELLAFQEESRELSKIRW